MKKFLLPTLSLLFAVNFISPALAGDFDKQIKARQSVMKLYSFNLGILGAMAKGEMDYDADLAKASADNLLATAKMNNGAMWPKGSDMATAGNENLTWAKAVIWSSFPKVGEKHQALTDAATKMAAEAGNGVDAIRANIGTVGGSCKACHDDFRAPKN
ncbi:MAG: c-type cytochrome [Rhizobiaceae bacterium]